jgi:hypothetical protein
MVKKIGVLIELTLDLSSTQCRLNALNVFQLEMLRHKISSTEKFRGHKKLVSLEPADTSKQRKIHLFFKILQNCNIGVIGMATDPVYVP